jgi:hypothetical protein
MTTEKQQTPLQKGIDEIDFIISMWKDPANEMDGLHTLEQLKLKLESLLPEEKQMVIDAYETSNYNDQVNAGEQYFNETYNQQK